MQCPNCDSWISSAETQCQSCGTKFAPRRFVFGAKKGDFTLTPEEPVFELGDESLAPEAWQFPLERETQPELRGEEKKNAATDRVRWGGFFRRTFAFIVDIVVLMALSTAMFLLSYVGYKVGLAAYGRSVRWENAMPLIVLLTWGWIVLVTGYFVLFHGMEGKTPGKWLLGLRVVGEKQGAITYGQAFVRWLAAVGFAPIALGFLWVLWSREKRGWHDFLARTWVIRD